jgi:hypothetical protein
VITRFACHSEEVAAATDEESRIALKIPRARFLAPLGMTAPIQLSHRLPKGRGGEFGLSLPSVRRLTNRGAGGEGVVSLRFAVFNSCRKVRLGWSLRG